MASASFGTRVWNVPGFSFCLTVVFFFPEAFFTKLKVVLLMALHISASLSERAHLFSVLKIRERL